MARQVVRVARNVALPSDSPALWWLRGSRRFRVQYGGRGSGKTSGATEAVIVLMLAKPGRRVACIRREKVAVKASLWQDLDRWIKARGVGHLFDVGRDRIVCTATGSECTFPGASDVTAETLRGALSGVHVCLIDEAMQLSEPTWRVLLPSLRPSATEPGSRTELWACFNPRLPTDPVYVDFVVNRRGADEGQLLAKRVNWRDNPFFPPELEAQRQHDERYDPRPVYLWKWEGHLMYSKLAEGVLPLLAYEDIDVCASREAWSRRPRTAMGRPVLGWDVAGPVSPNQGLVVRRGPCILHAEKFGREHWSEIGVYVDAVFARHRCVNVRYDATGVGSGAPATVRARPALGVNFGARVAGGTVKWLPRMTNEKQFYNRAAQLGWALRLRVQNTVALLAGADVDPLRCLFINPDIRGLADLKAELARPVWEVRSTGKTRIDKRGGDENAPSPDLYDATALAFALDSARGLKSRDWEAYQA